MQALLAGCRQGLQPPEKSLPGLCIASGWVLEGTPDCSLPPTMFDSVLAGEKPQSSLSGAAGVQRCRGGMFCRLPLAWAQAAGERKAWGRPCGVGPAPPTGKDPTAGRACGDKGDWGDWGDLHPQGSCRLEHPLLCPLSIQVLFPRWDDAVRRWPSSSTCC